MLDLLQSYQDQGYEVWLELGLQTAHNKTLKQINRGHDFQCYQATAMKGDFVDFFVITALKISAEHINNRMQLHNTFYLLVSNSGKLFTTSSIALI